MSRKRRLNGCGRQLTYVLRHDPASVGITLSRGGWADVPALLDGLGWDMGLLTEVVSADSKGRYELSADGTRVRALHGHSVDVDLAYECVRPPEILYHGTAEQSLGSIMSEGILSMERQFVHLSGRIGDARDVGSRHGRPVVLSVEAGRMADEGRPFHLSGDGVWLTTEVPPRFLSLVEGEDG